MGRRSRRGSDVGTSFKVKADSSVAVWAERAGPSAALRPPALLSVSLLESNKRAVLHAHLLHTPCAEGLDAGYNDLALLICKVETLISFFLILFLSYFYA